MLKKSYFLAALFGVVATVVLSAPVFAQQDSSAPADFVSNETVVYTMPDVGLIGPENPLFIMKSIRDQLTLAFPQNPQDKARAYIQMSDKYTMYAKNMFLKSRFARANALFQTSFKYASEGIDMMQNEYDHKKVPESTYGEIRALFTQSNVKQAEILRALLDEVPASEKAIIVDLMNENILLKHKLK